MAFSRITRTVKGAAALQYALQEKGHNGNKLRNKKISCVGMTDAISYEEQMSRYWKRATKNHKIQVLRIVQSFSKKEFNPDSEIDIEKANELGREFVKKYYPNRQAVVFTQTDGKGGCVHNHIIVNDVSYTDAKGCTKQQYFYKNVEKWTDEITSKYTILDFGKAAGDKTTQTERAKRIKHEYVWKDDLKSRIHDAMNIAESEDDFLEKLTENGVDAVKKTSKKYGEYYTYQLVDIPDDITVKNNKSRSYKLGFSYSPETVKNVTEENYEVKHKVKNEVKNEVKKTSEPDVVKKKKDFTTWRLDSGKSYTYEDENGETQYDWDMEEQLHREYAEYLAEQEVEDNVINDIVDEQEEENVIDDIIAEQEKEEMEFQTHEDALDAQKLVQQAEERNEVRRNHLKNDATDEKAERITKRLRELRAKSYNDESHVFDDDDFNY